MSTPAHKTAQLGDLVVAVFDKAAGYGRNSAEVSYLATRAVTHMLRGHCQPQVHDLQAKRQTVSQKAEALSSWESEGGATPQPAH